MSNTLQFILKAIFMDTQGKEKLIRGNGALYIRMFIKAD